MADNDNATTTANNNINNSSTNNNNGSVNNDSNSNIGQNNNNNNQLAPSPNYGSQSNALAKIKEEIEGEHSKRVAAWRSRATTADEQGKRLRDYVREKVVIEDIGGREQLAGYGYQMKCREEYNQVSQANTLYCQLYMYNNQLINKQRIPCRVYQIDQMSEPFRVQLFDESLKIWKYFSRTESISNFWLKVYEMLKADNCLYVFHERINYCHSLKHRLWNGEVAVGQVKGWAMQLAEAIDLLNTAGVAHRFVRMENVLVGSDQRIKLTSFDVACLFWNADERRPIRQNRGLPAEISRTFWDHLPPECFDDDSYDASMVDVWSLGTIICELLTRNNPLDFEAIGTKDSVGTGLIQQWIQSSERKTLLEEFRTLLDDVFNDFDSRISIFDLKMDKRLRYQSSVFCKVKLEPYYRIDVHKNLNLIEPKIRRCKSILPKVVSSTSFSKNSLDIFNLVSYKTIPNEEMMQTLGYQILRNNSFGSEFQMFKNDFYLKASVNDDQNYLAKIFVLSKIPIRHRNMLLNESSKIMRYFSNNRQTPSSLHRVVEIFMCEGKLYLFMENLLNYRTLDTVVRNFFKGQIKESIVRQWMAQLTELIDHLAYHGISHRYIRPEYVFVVDHEAITIKLSHFDLSCFVWNPARLVEVLRHRCLQDEQTQLWDHLAPECFDDKYDSLLVDVWSLGVLLVICLTLHNPFTVPFRQEPDPTDINQNSPTNNATDGNPWAMWRQFRTGRFKAKLAPHLDLLNQIFTHFDQRIHPSELAKHFSGLISNKSPDLTTSNSNVIGGGSSSRLSAMKKPAPIRKSRSRVPGQQQQTKPTTPTNFIHSGNNANFSSSTMMDQQSRTASSSSAQQPQHVQRSTARIVSDDEAGVLSSSGGVLDTFSSASNYLQKVKQSGTGSKRPLAGGGGGVRTRLSKTKATLGALTNSSNSPSPTFSNSNSGHNNNNTSSSSSAALDKAGSSGSSNSNMRTKAPTSKGIANNSKKIVGKLSNSIMQLFGNRKAPKKSIQKHSLA